MDPDTEETTEDYELRHLRPDPIEYPRLCPDIEPVGGRLRVEIEDFRVEEIPLYTFSGQGEHVYLTLTKTNRTTLEVRDVIARELGIRPEDVGFGGFKDKRAVTTQTFSLLGADEARVRALEASWLDVVAVTRHKNKIRPGHLKGNRFEIRIREVRAGALDAARDIIARALEFGLPNFYGTQRFGYTGDGHQVGHALLHRDPKQALDHLLAPTAEKVEEFRQHYVEERYEEALDALPPGRPAEAALLHTLIRHPGNHKAAARRIPRQLRRMYFSAYQSFLFNWALKERLEWGAGAFGIPELGDLAHIHERGACFLVEDLEEARERASRGEISPSGPIFGRKMSFPSGRPEAMERAILAAEKMRPQSFLSHHKGLKLDGTRRPFRIVLGEVDCTQEEPDSLLLKFTLPPGCYATILLDQIMGPGRVDKRYIEETA